VSEGEPVFALAAGILEQVNCACSSKERQLLLHSYAVAQLAWLDAATWL